MLKYILLSVGLCGCLDISLPSTPNQYKDFGTCSTYPQVVNLQDTVYMFEQDSSKMCPDNRVPVLFNVTWVSKSGECVSEIEDVYNGTRGIHRRFGCWKPKILSDTISEYTF